ncbi:MAG: hypothetical protein U0904_04990 [Candidatus Nanopelagicales bacterium]|nr:hypothetical protein [Candidatus Nanopelagicales bacterium]
MSDADIEGFLSRVFLRVPELSRDRFSSKDWRFEDRPTVEGIGLRPGVDVDVVKMVSRILDVEGYVKNMSHVAECEIIKKYSDTDFVYIQKISVPILGGIQAALRLVDCGDRNGYRAVAWTLDDEATDALDKKHGGARLAYSLGAWLIRPDEVGYALSSAPRKSDVGSLKFSLMTKGANTVGGEVLKAAIEGMIAWSKRD